MSKLFTKRMEKKRMEEDWIKRNRTKKIETTTVNGVEHVVEQIWDMFYGTKISETIYINGKKNGLCTFISGYAFFNRNATLKAIRNANLRIYEYKDDVIVRIVSICDEHGRECVLPPGDITVWKACRLRIFDPYRKLNLWDYIFLFAFLSAAIGMCTSSNELFSMIIYAIIGAITGIAMLISWLIERFTSGKYVYVRLTVPKEAQRITPIDQDNSFKSRVEYAKVEQIIDSYGKEYNEAFSCAYNYDKKLTYKIGEIVYPDKFDDNIMTTCGAGINVHTYKDQCEKWFR
jgi:hypothetical protein